MDYPTPVASGKLNAGTGSYQKLLTMLEKGEITPEEFRSMTAGNGYQLNPDWVGAMMGFPKNWLDI